MPVKLEGQKVHQSSVEWALGARPMHDGVLVAQTLFGNENNVKVARILNHTGSPLELSQGDFVGVADPVSVFQPPKPALGHRGNGPATNRDREWRMPFPHISHQWREAKDQQEHVQCLVDGLPKDLTKRQHQLAEGFIRSRVHSFSKADFDIGWTDIIKHHIDTGNNHPHYERLHRHPTSQLTMIDEQVEDMLRHDIIEPAASPWCSNVVMVCKKDGEIHFCIDYRKVNDTSLPTLPALTAHIRFRPFHRGQRYHR